MKSINTLNHAYSQAPWRIQRQWISVFLLTVLGFAIIAALYLIITSRAAILGREVQDLRSAIIETELTNANLQSDLGHLTSKNKIKIQAYILNFRPVNPEELEYLFVPGYTRSTGAVLATDPELSPSTVSIPFKYTETLLDWFGTQMQTINRGSR